MTNPLTSAAHTGNYLDWHSYSNTVLGPLEVCSINLMGMGVYMDDTLHLSCHL